MLFFLLGVMGVGIFIFVVGYVRIVIVVVICMCIGVVVLGLMYFGYNVNMLDIVLWYVCVIMGLINIVGIIIGFFSFMMVGYIIVNKVGLK